MILAVLTLGLQPSAFGELGSVLEPKQLNIRSVQSELGDEERAVLELASLFDAGKARSADAQALYAIVERLEQAMFREELGRDGARALFQASVRVAAMPRSLRPDGADVRTLLDLACEAARLGGDLEHRAYAYWRLGDHLRQSSANPEVIAESRAVFELALTEFPGARGMRPLLLIAWAKLERDFGSLAKTLELVEEAELALKAAGGASFVHAGVIEHSIAGVRAELHLALGNLDRVALFVARQEVLSAEMMRGDLALEAALNRAKLLLATHRWDALERHATDALRRWGANDERAAPGLRLCRAIGRMRSGEAADREGAKLDFESILVGAEEDPLHALTALTWLAELDLGERAFDAARARIEKARKLVEEREDGSSELRAFEAETLLTALEGRLMRLEKRPEPWVLHEVRARLEGALDGMVRKWRSAPDVRGGVGFLHYGGRRLVLSELVDAHLTGEDEASGIDGALRAVMRVQSLGSFARAKAAGADGWERTVERLVGPERGILLYLPGVERLHVFAMDRRGVVHVVVPALAVVEELRPDFVASVTTEPLHPDAGPTPDELELAERLGRALLPGRIAERVRGWKEVSIVGGDLLGYVPFEALRPFGGEPLGVRLAVSNLPSLPVGAWLLDRREGVSLEGGGFAILAAPKVSEEDFEAWPEALPIPFGSRESDRLTRGFAPQMAQVRVGSEATYDFLRSAFVRDARVLELLTHGVSAREQARGAGLLLAPSDDLPRFLGYEDVCSLSLPPLVVVAACGAMKGPSRPGEDGVASLAGAFLEAGADTVLLPRARVEYRAALGFLETLNEQLVAGDAPAEAARQARVRLRESGRAHPFHGLVHVVGLGHEPVFPRTR